MRPDHRRDLLGHADLMQGDLAHLNLAGLGARAQQQVGSVDLARDDGAEHLGVFVLGGVDAHLHENVEPAEEPSFS